MSVDRMDEQTVVYIYKWILFNHKKERKPDISYNINELWVQYTNWNKPVTKTQMLYEVHNQIHRDRKNPGCCQGEGRMGIIV